MSDNIIQIETFLINRQRKKICNCLKPHYEIDTVNRLIYCQTCRAILDPFDVLLRIATDCESLNDKVKEAVEYKNSLMNYKPYLKEARRYEQMMEQKDMLPICPHCKEPFEWEKLCELTNKNFYKNKEPDNYKEKYENIVKKIEDTIKYWEGLIDEYLKSKQYGQVDIALYKIRVLKQVLGEEK